MESAKPPLSKTCQNDLFKQSSVKTNSILCDMINYFEKTKAQAFTITSTLYVEASDIVKKTKLEELRKKELICMKKYFRSHIILLNNHQGIISNNIQFSAQTSYSKILSMLSSKLFKKSPNMLGNPKNPLSLR